MSESVQHPGGQVEGTPLSPAEAVHPEALVTQGQSSDVIASPETVSQPDTVVDGAPQAGVESTDAAPAGVDGMHAEEVARPPAERLGVSTGLTREELLATLAIRRRVRDIRMARLGRVGPDVDRGGPARRRRLRSS